MKLWKMGPNSPVCPQIIAICGQITVHVHKNSIIVERIHDIIRITPSRLIFCQSCLQWGSLYGDVNRAAASCFGGMMFQTEKGKFLY